MDLEGIVFARCPVCELMVPITRFKKLEDHSIGSVWKDGQRVKRELCEGSGEPASGAGEETT